MHCKLLRWLRESMILVLLLTSVLLVIDAWRAPQIPADFGSAPLQTLDGKNVTLAALSEERPLLLYIWASWCGVCRFTTGKVAALSASGENVMTIAYRSGSSHEVSRGLSRKGGAFPVINDVDGAISRLWGINVTPTFVVISKGRVISTTSGWTSSWGMKLRLWWATMD
ncbi:protein disulfide oxidoreductase [Escherichia coli]|uniref:Secreted copper-sensitivity suppressor D n=1 Tax=Escherichia coli TA447 TaxID=656447 RepID=A0A1X3IU40_ECOLX|nr:protein disulfide oxidoreductase [Escherichia coli]OSK88010.1 secreted copper-sensitivity suppressor D [Escherichia coli TA447]